MSIFDRFKKTKSEEMNSPLLPEQENQQGEKTPEGSADGEVAGTDANPDPAEQPMVDSLAEPQSPLFDEEHPVAKDYVRSILQELNCEFQADDRPKSCYYQFDYQGGHFRIDASAVNGAMSIEYPFIYDVEVENVDVVRTFCNDMNCRTRFSKFIYSYNEQSHRVFMHITTGFNIPDKAEERLAFKGVLESHFGLQREFVNHLKKAIEEKDKKSPVDRELEDMRDHRLQFLLNEQEIWYEPEKLRANAGKTVTLGQLIEQLLEEKKELKWEELRVVTDSLLILGGDEKIRNYSILSALIEGEGPDAKLKTDEATLIAKGPKESLTIQIAATVDAEKAFYFRVYVMAPAFRANASAQLCADVGVLTFVLAYDKTTEENHEAEFRYMWEDALEKRAANKVNEMTDEQKIICDLDKSDWAMELYWGKKYFEEKRFYEALIHLEFMYREMNLQFQQLSQEMQDRFFHICFLIGFCYNELRLFTKAYFYLDIVSKFHRFVDTTEYVNCLVNSKDFRAIYVINVLLDSISKSDVKEEDEEDDDKDEMSDVEHHDLMVFRNFLRRRKAHVLIDIHQLAEAEKLLQELLKEPENADFALHELAYIQRLKH